MVWILSTPDHEARSTEHGRLTGCSGSRPTHGATRWMRSNGRICHGHPPFLLMRTCIRDTHVRVFICPQPGDGAVLDETGHHGLLLRSWILRGRAKTGDDGTLLPPLLLLDD